MIPVAIAHPVITPSAHLLGTSIRQSKTIAITMQMIIVDITNFLLIGYIYNKIVKLTRRPNPSKIRKRRQSSFRTQH